MKISYAILKKFLPGLSLLPGEVAEMLTMGGFEVEGISSSSGSATDIAGVTIARILKIEKHPRADRLSVVEVDTGKGTTSVVCGAPNLKVGMKSPFAGIGAKIRDGVEVRKAKIRGVESVGMLLSEYELGISEDHSGIMELDSESAVGVSFPRTEPGVDTVFEVNVLPNRPDCLSHLGIAREISVLAGLPWQMPPMDTPEGENDFSQFARVELEAPELCPRYAARVITGVRIDESPQWLKDELAQIGQRPINNVVDATNYVLFLLGQPLHAFDLHRLGGREIRIRKSRKGEKITTIDHVERSLSEGILIIADRDNPVALAGVMGGEGSEVSPDTVDILLESAGFSTGSIRNSSRVMGLDTESSLRFKRGVDPEGVVVALNYVTGLIAQITGGTIARGVCDHYPRKPDPVHLRIHLERARNILGIPVKQEESIRILTGLDFQPVSRENGDHIEATVPSYRFDLKEEADLIEELARVIGYDKVPPCLPVFQADPRRWNAPEQKRVELERKIRDALVHQGFHQVITYSFLSDSENRLFSPQSRAISISNPLSETMQVMRGSLLPGLLGVMAHNWRRKYANIRLFEIGRVFQHDEVDGNRLCEKNRVAGLVLESNPHPYWQDYLAQGFHFFHVKGLLENLFEWLTIRNISFLDHAHPVFEPGNTGSIAVGPHGEIGVYGRMEKAIIDSYGVTFPVYAFECDIDPLVVFERAEIKFVPFPRHPGIEWDIAFIVDEAVTCQEVSDIIFQSDRTLIQDVRIVDLYHGKDQVPEGKKSMAFRISYLSPERTLTDDEVRIVHQKVVENIREKLSAVIRE